MKNYICYEGHCFGSFEELSDFAKNNPASDVLVWDYQERQNLVIANGKLVPQGK